jgi:hypothetical protein
MLLFEVKTSGPVNVVRDDIDNQNVVRVDIDNQEGER